MAFHSAKPIDQGSLAPSELKAHLCNKFPDLDAVERHRFVMVADLAELIFSSRKSSTIRYSKGAVEYPSAQELPLFVVSDHREKAVPTCIGALHIGAVCYKTLAELSDSDARKDGFASKADLVHALHTFYGDIQASDVLSVFEFTLSAAQGAGKTHRRHKQVGDRLARAAG
ncbi:ASCH domain-containing protein [Ensifer sp. BR816]|uniref:ASCH domain-containing protein n=1 Tax=Rhizobium sp. (strain BR816) TaxID=1057002 RepID=UPI001FD98BC3|nr:ASCH domain-containing protein [Ensifer sp. BR816]